MKRHREGFVLVVVLWVLAIITVTTIGFGQRAYLDRHAAYYALDHTQAMYMARAAVNRGIVELRNKMVKDYLQEDERRITYIGQPWSEKVDIVNQESYFNLGEAFAQDGAWFEIEDAERRISINRAPEEILEELPQLDRSVLRRILKRRTEGEHEGEGSTPFQALEELLAIEGIDEEAWYGADGVPGLRDLLTVWGSGRINVNTALPEVLACIPDLGDSSVGAILAYRAGTDGELYTRDDRGFKSMQDLSERTGIEGDPRRALDRYCMVQSAHFKIKGTATRRTGKVRAACSAFAEVVDSRAKVVAWQEESFGA